MKLWIFVSVLISIINSVSLASEKSAKIDLETIKQRLIQEILSEVPKADAATWQVNEINKWISEQRDDGSFKSFDYEPTTLPAWGALQTIASAYQFLLATKTPGHPFYQSKDLLERMKRAVHFVASREWDHINWWHKEIGLPLITYKFLLLLQDEIPEEDKKYLLRLTRKGHIVDHPSGWAVTGANLVWYAEITLGLGVLFNEPEWIKLAVKFMEEELTIGKYEGIQIDQSFHQHGKVFYNGGYGLSFCVGTSKFFPRVDGTRWAFSQKSYQIMSDYILDGQLWLMHKKMIDYSSRGRENARKGGGLVKNFIPICDRMGRVNGKYQKQFKLCSEELKNDQYMGKTGNKIFYRSDFMTHGRENFAISVKMQSERTLNADTSPLGEGLKQHHMSDGVTYFYRSGEEYFDIAPIYDFSLWNGITVDYPETYPLVPNNDYWPSRGLSDFAGGVSDGRNGAATMWFKSRLLHAKKSWFFHDEGMIALGADISLYKEQNTRTSINQEWNKGDFYYGLKKDNDEKILKDQKVTLVEPSWVYAQGMGYDLISPQNFVLQNIVQEGNWKSIAVFLSDEKVRGNVSSLWIEHGLTHHEYAYAVYPQMNKDVFKERLKKPRFEILSNTGKIQAVWFDNNQVQIIFHSPGKIETKHFNNLTIEVDKPIALLIKQNAKGLDLYTSAPNQKVAKAKFIIQKKGKRAKKFFIDYPLEQASGSTIKRSIEY